MRDYYRRQNQQAMTGVVEVTSRIELEEPSRYKSKFKLNTWSSRKNKTKNSNSNSGHAGSLDSEVGGRTNMTRSEDEVEIPRDEELTVREGLTAEVRRLPKRIFSLGSGTLDPFDSLSIKLGPQSERLFAYC